MNFKKFHVSKNLFDYSTVTTGYRIQWITGDDYPDDTTVRSDYISVNSGTYSCSDSVIVLGYDANKDYLGATNGDGVFEKIAKIPISQFTVPTNSLCKYIKILAFNSSVPMNIDAETMLNTGSTPQPYEPYSSEVWHDIPHYIHNTSTDTLTTLPADIYANDNNATVGLKGNMEQSGTPTPTTPIQPQECGERTGNLFDKSKRTDNSRVVYTTGEIGSLYGVFVSDFIPIEPNTTYTLNIVSSISGKTGHLYALYDVNKNFVDTGAHTATPATEYTFTTPSDIAYIRFNGNMASVDEIMLNPGSTAIPYEPFGYKIPILSNSQTTNVYLGEVQSTRKIKKYEFTGQENFQNISADASIFGVYGLFNTEKYIPLSGAFSTHYNYISNQSDLVNVMRNNDFVMFKQTESLYNIAFKDNRYSDRTDFKTYLANQYSAGTPVTVWYVLSEPQTAVVNEPLRKIGDYADEVSGITIPTIAGANTLSIGTTLQPSEVTATYKGWHPVSAVHERESGAWT